MVMEKVIERITTTQSPAETDILEELSSLDTISNVAAFIVFCINLYWLHISTCSSSRRLKYEDVFK